MGAIQNDAAPVRNKTYVWETWQKPWLFAVYRGWNTTQLCGIYWINHEIRIAIKQPVFLHSRVVFFSEVVESMWQAQASSSQQIIITMSSRMAHDLKAEPSGRSTPIVSI